MKKKWLIPLIATVSVGCVVVAFFFLFCAGSNQLKDASIGGNSTVRPRVTSSGGGSSGSDDWDDKGTFLGATTPTRGIVLYAGATSTYVAATSTSQPSTFNLATITHGTSTAWDTGRLGFTNATGSGSIFVTSGGFTSAYTAGWTANGTGASSTNFYVSGNTILNKLTVTNATGTSLFATTGGFTNVYITNGLTVSGLSALQTVTFTAATGTSLTLTGALTAASTTFTTLNFTNATGSSLDLTIIRTAAFSSNGTGATSTNLKVSSTANLASTLFTGATGTHLVLNGTLSVSASSTLTLLNFTHATGTSLNLTGSLRIPNGTAPVFSAVGQVGWDTSDNQLLVATSTNDNPVVIPTTMKLWGGTVASTSNAFVSGGTIPLSPIRDGVKITEIHCYVVGGTSVVINLDAGAGGSNTDQLTCATTLTSDTAMSANFAISAGALMNLEIGTITGSVNYVSFSVWGTYTRE